MSAIRQMDLLVVNELFERKGEPGYILNFTDRTFADFFASEVGVDIDDPTFAANGKSKGKRLRYFLQVAEDGDAIKALTALWEYRQALLRSFKKEDEVANAEIKFRSLMDRFAAVDARSSAAKVAPPVKPLADEVVSILRDELLSLSQLEPQPRGYAFEKVLTKLFDAYGLEAREPFRCRGEQIDGSFALQSETYLLEAKWQNALTAATDLRSFNGKVEDKAAWSRGLFISNSGFTEDGLHAFGRGKRVVCMDGRDLYDVLSQGRSLTDALSRKVRRAAETGQPFVRVCDLY